MRLSEAMMLGSTTCKMVPCNLNSCALGAACNALGAPEHKHGVFSRWGFVSETWPWTKETGYQGLEDGSNVDACNSIWLRFDFRVCEGKMTLEQLVDYVRSLEPECGDCNEFVCTCVQKMDETPTLQLQEVTR